MCARACCIQSFQRPINASLLGPGLPAFASSVPTLTECVSSGRSLACPATVAETCGSRTFTMQHLFEQDGRSTNKAGLIVLEVLKVAIRPLSGSV